MSTPRKRTISIEATVPQADDVLFALVGACRQLAEHGETARVARITAFVDSMKRSMASECCGRKVFRITRDGKALCKKHYYRESNARRTSR